MANKQLLKNIFLVLLGILSRIIPHPGNFTAIIGVSIFSGNPILPIISMLISDYIIGFDSLTMRLTVYSCIILAAFAGKWAQKNKNFKNIFKTTLFSSTLFFIVTNFVVWLNSSMYTKDLIGLVTCYTLAIPFFKNALLGDFFYTGSLFGISFIFKHNFSKFKSLFANYS